MKAVSLTVGGRPLTVQTVLPIYHVSGRSGDRRGGFEAYREETQDVFEICLPRGSDVSPFEISSWNLGGLLLTSVDSAALSFDRSRRLVAVSGLDHFMVVLYVSGHFWGVADREDLDVRPGDICVLDLTRTLRTEVTRFHNLSLVIPRTVVEASMDDPDALHGLVLRRESPLTELLSSHIRMLHERIARLSSEEAEAASRATAGFVTAVLSSHHQGRPEAVLAAISPLRAAVRMIDQNLHDPTLDVAWLARSLGLSRSALYRLFETRGGVAHFIRERRLIQSAMDLASPANRNRRVADVARRWGFNSHAVFTRAFQAHYGISPTEARHEAGRLWAVKGPVTANPAEPELASWLKMLRAGAQSAG